MKVPGLMLFAVLAMSFAAQTNPLEKVLQMLSDLQGKIIAEGEGAQKMYTEFSSWCESRSQELHFEVKTAKSQVQSLSAAIEKGTADSQALESKISDSASDISEDESELKEATSIREGENKNFVEIEKELMTTANMLENALSVIQKEMKGGAFLQTENQQSAQTVVQALRAMVEASSISSADASKLTALVQTASEDSDESDEVGAPAAAATENQSGGIVEVLEGLLDKAESQLDKARKEEQSAAQEYAMKKQSLEDSGNLASNELKEAKSGLAATKEKKAVNEGDLQATQKDLKEGLKELEELHHNCLGKATDFEEETKSRDEELNALNAAKKIITETTGGAASQGYGLIEDEDETSFVQVSSKAQLSQTAHALRIIRRMAYADHSLAMTQLASRIQSTMRMSSRSGANPFQKVQDMVMDMMASLEKEAEAEAGEKEYCDKEIAETTAKLGDKSDSAQSLSTKISQMVSGSQKLKGEVTTLSKELGSIIRTQAEIDQLRQKENAAYKANKPEMEAGLNGVKKALKVLKEYYAKASFVQTQAGTKGPSEIIGLLEVSESDFSKLLAEMIAEEEQAQAAYEETSAENTVAKKTKEQDIKYKTKEAAGLDKGSTELKGDLTGASDELNAIQDYDKQLSAKCTKMPPSYEEVKKAREAEIAGLKEALTSIGGGAALIQETATHRTLRGISRA